MELGIEEMIQILLEDAEKDDRVYVLKDEAYAKRYAAKVLQSLLDCVNAEASAPEDVNLQARIEELLQSSF